MAGVSMKITYRFRKDISQKINRMPLRYFDGTNHGEVLSRITNDVDTVSQTLNQSLTQIITSVTTVVGVLIMMFTINWIMTLVALTIVPLSMVIISFVIQNVTEVLQAAAGLPGACQRPRRRDVRRPCRDEGFQRRGKKRGTVRRNITMSFTNVAWKSQFLSGMMMPVMAFVGNLGYVAMCILGGYLAIRNAITFGDIQAFIQYVRSFTQPLAQIANISNILQQTAAAAERVFEFMAEPEEVARRPSRSGSRQ